MGTSHGSSALGLGDAARATGGKMLSFDVPQGKVVAAAALIIFALLVFTPRSRLRILG